MTQKEKNLDKKHLDKIKNIESQPIFILGLHRTGTSILYKMLAKTNLFNQLTAYHIIEYDRLIYNRLNELEKKEKSNLEQFFIEKNIVNRKIDELEAKVDSPEEYQFILSKMSIAKNLNLNNIKIFIEMCKKIQYIYIYIYISEKQKTNPIKESL